MKLTRRGHYSVKAMLDLVVHGRELPVSVKAIAARQSLPPAFLEKLLIALRRAKLVASIRGPQGGYYLARSPKSISLGDILAAVGEDVQPLRRLTGNAQRADDWVTFAVWQRLDQKLKEALHGISLEDLYYDACSWQAAQGQEVGFII